MQLYLPCFDASYKAKTALSFVHFAGARADIALHATVRQ
jgi:hypothetical protein